MHPIIYKGLFREEVETFSSYQIGWATHEEMSRIRATVSPIDLYNGREGFYQTLVVKRYIQNFYPLLWQWLKEMKISFRGIVYPMVNGYGCYEIKLLLFHHSQEDLAFRLCYDVKMMEE